MDYVEDIGITWIRDEGNWSGEDAEPGYNPGELGKLQEWVGEAHRRGFKVMVHLGMDRPNLRRPDAYAKYAGLVARALRGKVQAYHGPNEPYGEFLSAFYPELVHTMRAWNVEVGEPWRPWIEEHSELVRKAADAIHEADPDAVMMPEGVDTWRQPSDVFFTHHRWMFEAGLGENVSALAVHPYTAFRPEGVRGIYVAPPEITTLQPPAGVKKDYPYFNDEGRVSLGAALQELRDQAKKVTGRDVEVWINEWGYSLDWPSDTLEENRSAYLVRMFLVGFANNARMVGWYNLRDWTSGRCGLLDNEYKKRPAYFAYKTMSKTLGDLYLLRYAYGSPMETRGVQAYLFGKDAQRTLVVWNIDNTERAVKVDGVEPGVRIIDIYGKEIATEAADGVVRLTVDGKPQYLVGVTDAVSVTDETVTVAVAPAPKPAVNTALTAPAEIPAPVGGNTLTLGRRTGRASVKAAHESLVLDSAGLGFVGLNLYDDGDVSLANGGGNVGVGTSRPNSALEIRRSQDATTFLEINNPYPKPKGDGYLAPAERRYQGNAGAGIKFTGYRYFPIDSEAARIESKYISRHGDGLAIVGDLRFHTSASWGNVLERMRITYDGDVGIGTKSPASKLEVNGDIRAKTYISTIATIEADNTSPDVSVGDILLTSANTRATAITELTNASVGQTVCIIGGSDVNPSTIADDGRFKLSAPWTANKNDVLILLVLAADNYVEMGRVDN